MNYRFNISSPLIFVFWTATCTPATNEPTSQSSMGASNGRTTWRDGSRGKIPRAILWHVKDVVSQYQVADWGDQCSASSLFLGRSNISSLLPFLRRGVILLILIWFEDPAAVEDDDDDMMQDRLCWDCFKFPDFLRRKSTGFIYATLWW